MPKITLNDVVNLQNETTAVNTIDTNKSRIATAFENTLSRDGTSPNEMESNFDMNSYHILNLGAPVRTTDPVRKIDLDNGIGSAFAALQALSSSSLINVNNSLFPEQFGAVGNGIADDSAAVQAWMVAVANTGKEGHLTFNKTYLFSDTTPTFGLPAGSFNIKLYGHGSRFTTDKTKFMSCMNVQNSAPVTRPDETRQLLIDGFVFDQYGSEHGVYGLDLIGSTHVTIQNCSFIGGSDGVTPYAGQAGLHVTQGDPFVPGTSCFWTRVDNCVFEGGFYYMAFGIFSEGQNNAMIITRCEFTNLGKAISINRITTGNDFDLAALAGGWRILGNDFESLNFGVYITGTAGFSEIGGLTVAYNRIESVSDTFFLYSLDRGSISPPIIGPNYIVSEGSPSGVNQYLGVAANLPVDVRDIALNKVTFDPISISANSTSVIFTTPVYPSVIGDYVTVECSGDLSGLVATGWVSAEGLVKHGTVSVRLTNPTNTAINLPSLNWTVRVRKGY